MERFSLDLDQNKLFLQDSSLTCVKILNTFKTVFFLLLTLSVINSFATENEKPYQVIDGKIDKEMFVKIVVNGRSGTLMKPFKNNNRVIDNLDNIYAYLKARSDGVLGPENLIKFPLGKK